MGTDLVPGVGGGGGGQGINFAVDERDIDVAHHVNVLTTMSLCCHAKVEAS